MENNRNIYIGKILKKYRILKGYTQEKVSEITGLAPRYISQIERELSNGSLDTLVKLCDAYDITPNHVLSTRFNTPDSCYEYNALTNYNKLNTNNKLIIDKLIDILLEQQN